MKKLLIILLLIAGHFEFIYAEYISPGIQIGLNSKKEFFYSYQLTIGEVINRELEFFGITLGRRHFIRKKTN